MSKSTAAEWTAERIKQRVETLGPWFHNINLKGVQTAPSHFLGDYPRVKWRGFAEALPADLTGKSVLDIGCNGGFYALEMKRRGADRVLAVDFDPRYLAQARFAAEVEQLDIEFRQLSVYDVATLGERFDIVFFIGVFYHLRHPLLALDLIHDHVARDIMVFQSMQRGSKQVLPVQPDYDFWEQDMFDDPASQKCTLSSKAIQVTPQIGGRPTGPAPKPCCAVLASTSPAGPRRKCISALGAHALAMAMAPFIPHCRRL